MKKTIGIVALVLLVAVFGIFAIYSEREITNLKSENSTLKADLKKNAEGLEATDRRAFALPHEAYSLRRLAFDPSSNMLYIPELKIRVPYSTTARSLLYTMRDEAPEADVTTDAYLPPQERTTLACADFLRLKIEDTQSPYNPAEKATSFKMEDGRTLQVYYFTGELEGNAQCKKSYESSVSPKDFVKAFNSVESY